MEEKKENLLVRLGRKLKYGFTNSKVVRRIATLALAGSLALGTAGCFGTNPTPNPGPNGNTDTPTTQYSAILEDVLEDEYYNGLIDAAKDDFNLYRSASFDPHPYAFLEKKGHDVDAIKAGDLTCRTVSYVMENEPNNLYMMTYVENKSSDPYYTEYTLKYTLSEKEMKEYTFLHKDGSDYYIQAVFMNDAISEHKNATILSETKMNVEAHKEMREKLKNINTVNKTYGSSKINIILKDFNESNQTFSLVAYPMYSNNTQMTTTNYLTELYPTRGNQKLNIVNGVYYAPNTYGNFDLTEEQINVLSVTYYHSQDTILGNVFTQDLNDNSIDT